MKRGEVCREGCSTRDHYSYAECLRAANVSTRFRAQQDREWNREVDAYRQARAEGIQPDSTKRHDVEVAKAFSDKEGVAYDAGDKSGTLLRAKGYA